MEKVTVLIRQHVCQKRWYYLTKYMAEHPQKTVLSLCFCNIFLPLFFCSVIIVVSIIVVMECPPAVSIGQGWLLVSLACALNWATTLHVTFHIT